MKKFEDQMKKLRKEIAVFMVPTIQKVSPVYNVPTTPSLPTFFPTNKYCIS